MQIRLSKPNDITRLCEILNQALDYKIKHKDTTWDTDPFVPKELQKSIVDKARYSVIINGFIVGTFILSWEDEKFWGKQSNNAVYLHQLAISNNYRRQGLGAKIFNCVNEKAKTEDKEFIRIDFSPDNKGLKKYYEQLGFKYVNDRIIESLNKSYTASLYERPVQ